MTTATATRAYVATAAQTLQLYGDVGSEILAADVAAALTAANGRPVMVNLFSYGGDAGEGLAIHDQLARYGGTVTVTIDGVAASAGSLIAMAGDRVVMPENALLMIHDCWSMAAGNADAMRSSADLLDTYSASYRQTYARKSGQSEATVAEWMAAGSGAGTWFTAEAALAAGLIDEVTPAAPIQASAPRLPADRFASLPAALLNSWALVDTLAVTDNNSPTLPLAMTTQSLPESAAVVDADAAGELSRSEANRQLQITRSAAMAGLSPAETEAIISSTRTTAEGLSAVIQAHAAAVEGRAAGAGHPARIISIPASGTPGGLEGTILAALRGERQEPVWLALRAAGIGHGNDPAAVWRSALSGEGRWTARGSLSTSDLPNLLTASGNRRLMERFQVADSGIRAAVTVRRLNDYRAASVIDAGMVGKAVAIGEGGEIRFAAVDEAAASYSPARYGLGLTFTPEAMANDDLQGLDAALAELADAMLDAENTALVDLLEGAANGRNSIDGKALFHNDHANTVAAGPLSIASIGAAVEKMRNQKAIGGRYIAQEPGAIICGTAAETSVRQLLSDAINAAQASNVNPWRNLAISVEPRLSGSYAYIVGSGRKPLELGRLTEGPQLTTELEFSTGNYRAKSEHAFGCIVSEHRSIVRIPTAGA